MGKLYTYSTIWDKNIVRIIHIYGPRDILLLLCVHQGTKSEQCEI